MAVVLPCCSTGAGGKKKWVAPSGTGQSHDFANIDVLGEFSGKEQQCRVR